MSLKLFNTQEHPVNFFRGHWGDGILIGISGAQKLIWTYILGILGEF